MASRVEELGEWIAEQAAHLDAATHCMLTAVRELDASNGWYAQGARSCAEWLSSRVGWSQQTARDRVRVARRLGELPLVDDELRRGALSYCKVRALTRVATAANEAALVDMAKHSTGTQLDRICRKYAAVQHQGSDPDPSDDAEQRHLARRDLDDGFVEISARLRPEEAAALWAALDRIAKDRASSETQRERRADALVFLAEQVLRGENPDCSPTELVVTVEADTLREPSNSPDPIGTLADGTCVSAETVRRMSCDCGVVHRTEDASTIDRKTRSIPTSIKRALLRRDQTCRFPGCTRDLFLEGHHVEHWATGGKATLRNLVGLCSDHHRYVHEYGYRLELDGAQQPHFFDPQGRRIVVAPPPPASAPVREWDGSHADFNWAASAVASNERPQEPEFTFTRWASP